MRRIDKKRYIIVGMLTVFIFILGLLLGLVIESERVSYVENLYKQESIELESSQLQFAFVDTLNDKGMCPALLEVLDRNVRQSDESRIRLEKYENDKSLKGQDFDLLKREYTLSLIKFWMLADKAKKTCDKDILRVLYFYSTDAECPKCDEQAIVLTSLKHEFKDNLLVFALDSNFKEEPMIQVLIKQFNVKKFPTLVLEINPLEGYVPKDELNKEFCKYFINTGLPACEKYEDELRLELNITSERNEI